MQVRFTLAERVTLIGADDRSGMFIGIPLVAALGAMLIHPSLSLPATWPHALLIAYGMGLLFTTLYWTVIRVVILNLRKLQRIRQDTGVRLGITFSTATVVVVLIETTIHLGLKLLPSPLALKATLKPDLWMEITIGILLSWMVTAIYEAVYYAAELEKSRNEKNELLKLQIETQYDSLRNQLNPHFLFNSLNTLASLIPEDDVKAVRFVERLSSVYRRILEHSGQETVLLRDEIKALEDYLFLMRSRYEEKLIVKLSLPEDALDARIIPMGLQMLVENAIKHNIVSTAKPLSIDIRTEGAELVVSNTLQVRQTSASSTGIGLQNIRERYRLLTKQDVSVALGPAKFEVRLPLLAQEKMNPDYA